MSDCLVFLFLFGCSVSESYIDPYFLPYYHVFEYESERLGVDLPSKYVMIIWKDMDSDRAHCHTRKTSIKICVNSNFFDQGSEYDHKLEATIFHELGHGLLGRWHMEPVNGVETSLMTVPGMREQWIDGTKREYYLKELFNGPTCIKE